MTEEKRQHLVFDVNHQSLYAAATTSLALSTTMKTVVVNKLTTNSNFNINGLINMQ